MRYLYLLIAVLIYSCSTPNNQNSKVPVYVWIGGGLNDKEDTEIYDILSDLKSKGVDGIMYNGGHDPASYEHIGAQTSRLNMDLHAWIPTMVQAKNEKIEPDWYIHNRNGESALDSPAYVPYYTFLCPSKEGVKRYLKELYASVARVEHVKGVHLDYIRFPDVILAPGLWDKYGLTMDKEYAPYDYCYCEDCTKGFESKTGNHIRLDNDAPANEAWKQYRYDLITDMVKAIADTVHSEGKELNAAVFPGPSIAKKLVRQEWSRWTLDAVYPMNYNDFYLEGTQWIGDIVHEEVHAAPYGVPVYSGLFICPDPARKSIEKDPEGHGLLPEELGEAIRQSMENGATGICLFTPGRMTEAHWVEFEKAIYKDYSDAHQH